MTFDPTARLDLHERFLQILRRERERHAAHVRFVKQLPLRAIERDRGSERVWTCPRCASVYVTRAREPACWRCADDVTADAR